MALESSTYIDGLVPTNPTSSDGLSQGDDHLRLLKSTLKNSFPNVSGAVTATHTELSYTDGVTSPIQTQIDTKAPLASPTFTGTVVLPSTTSVGNVSSTELGYLDGVTSSLQTQLDAKAASVHTHLAADITDLGSLATLNAVNGTQISLASQAQGDVLYYNGSAWARLPAGTSGTFLKTNGSGANPEWANASSGAPDVIIQDQKASGTDGGTFSSGADRTRTLNTLVRNANSLASLASNQFTLPAGTYYIEWSAPAAIVAGHQSLLYNVTATTVVARGQSGYAGTGSGQTGFSNGCAVVTVAASTAFEIRHRCGTTGTTSGFGYSANFGTEIYTEVKIWKTA